MSDTTQHDMTLNDRIAWANKLLDDWRPESVTSDPTTGYTGFKAQFVIDAANVALGVDRWRYEIDDPAINTETTRSGNQVELYEFRLSLFVKLDDGTWFCKGPNYGGGRGDRDETDGKKAGISDAIKKAFSFWGVGSAAYRGEIAKPTAQMQGRSKRQSSAAAPPPASQAPAQEMAQPPLTTVSPEDAKRVLAEMAKVKRVEGGPMFTTRTQALEWFVAIGLPPVWIDGMPAVINGEKVADYILRKIPELTPATAADQPDTGSPEPPSNVQGGQPWQGAQ